MGFFKSLFGGSPSSEDKRKDEDSKNFDTLKYDGVRALKQGQFGFAIKCFTHALDIQEDLECRDYLSQAYMHTDELSQALELRPYVCQSPFSIVQSRQAVCVP